MVILAAFFIGIVCAVMSSAPVGPINFAIMQATWARGKLPAALIGLGGTLADASYALAAWWISDWLVGEENPAVFAWLNVLTIPVVVFLGWRMIAQRHQNSEQVVPRRKGGDFLVGFALGISNPSLLLYWLGAIAYAQTGGWLETGILNLLAFIIGILLGVFGCFLLVILLTSRLTRSVSDKYLSWFSLAIGGGFILFGIFLAVRAVWVYVL